MNKLIKKTAAAGLTAMLMLTGCAKGTAPASDKPLKADPAVKTEIDLNGVATKRYDEKKLNDEYGRYTFELLQKVSENVGKNGNLMVSPASIMMALDMVSAGAKGETLKQLTALFAEDTDPLEQQAFASELMRRINNAKKVEFACANAIWNDSSRLGEKMNTDYRDYIKKTFEAEFKTVKFGLNTHIEINKWVDEKTNHMIPTLFDSPLGEDTVMVLVNAIRFEAQWKNGYEEGQISDRNFKGTNGEKQVKMLSSTENSYFSTEKAKGFIKYYEGEEYAFIAILPNDEKADATEFMSKFSYEDYKKFIESRKYGDVHAMMPEFKSDYKITLNEILKKLGATDVFDKDKCDLTGIAQPDGGNLFLSKVIHKTHIEVDRKGTKAAAVTGATLDVASAMPSPDEIKEVICDRPYAYAIVDTLTMNPIFIGTVNNVE